jgi:hypothetical protein
MWRVQAWEVVNRGMLGLIAVSIKHHAKEPENLPTMAYTLGTLRFFGMYEP